MFANPPGLLRFVGQSLKGDDVVRTRNQLKLERGVPKMLFCDNGSEFTSQAMDLWAFIATALRSTSPDQAS
jgi:hypothetical protein